MNQKQIAEADRELGKFHRSLENLVLAAWAVALLALTLTIASKRAAEMRREAESKIEAKGVMR